ncbi:MAG TPA: LysR family transcriptional regulator [Arenibaculum sp.]|jgi:DNA-binding transcriptional LysR family regulator|nr:LysR family transcriptional regulator [Arenibaculum sp.]
MPVGLDDVAVFLEVVRTGGFSAAARGLNMPVSTVSRRVASLEGTLNVQLLKRTTRAVSLTDDGRAFAERCGAAVAEIVAAADAVTANGGELRGTLRVTAPHYACNAEFGPYLLDFAAAHPGLRLDLRLTNGSPDLVEEGIDVSFQLSPLPEGRHVARRLWPVPYVLCAARGFVADRPGLAGLSHPRQLGGEACVLTPPIGAWAPWRSGAAWASAISRTGSWPGSWGTAWWRSRSTGGVRWAGSSTPSIRRHGSSRRRCAP